MKLVEWAKDHPGLAAVSALGGILLFMFLFRGNSGSSNNGAAAFYAAQAAQAQAGDAVQIAQINATATTAQTQIAGTTSVTNNTTWANTDLAITQSNNAVAPALAQYGFESNLVDALAGVASQPGSTVTSTKKSNGFLGIGGHTTTTSTYVPNPAATNAEQLLGQLFGSMSFGNTGMNVSH